MEVVVQRAAGSEVWDSAVAAVEVLGRSVKVVTTPHSAWKSAYRKLGFSADAADAYARMTDATVNGEFPSPDDTEQGPTTLEDYIASLVDGGSKPGVS